MAFLVCFVKEKCPTKEEDRVGSSLGLFSNATTPNSAVDEEVQSLQAYQESCDAHNIWKCSRATTEAELEMERTTFVDGIMHKYDITEAKAK